MSYIIGPSEHSVHIGASEIGFAIITAIVLADSLVHLNAEEDARGKVDCTLETDSP